MQAWPLASPRVSVSLVNVRPPRPRGLCHLLQCPRSLLGDCRKWEEERLHLRPTVVRAREQGSLNSRVDSSLPTWGMLLVRLWEQVSKWPELETNSLAAMVRLSRLWVAQA